MVAAERRIRRPHCAREEVTGCGQRMPRAQAEPSLPDVGSDRGQDQALVWGVGGGEDGAAPRPELAGGWKRPWEKELW